MMTEHDKRMLLNAVLTGVLMFVTAFVIGVTVIFEKGGMQ